MSEISRAQWNGTFRLHRPDPGHRVFGFRSCNQDTKERYWGQQFVKWKGHFLPYDRNDHAGQSGPPSKLVTNIPVGRTKPKYTNRNLRNFGLNRSTLEFLSKTLMTLPDCTWTIEENILPFVIFHPMKALGELMLPLKSLCPNKLTQKLHQLLFHHHYDNVVTIIIITVSIILF